MLISKVINPFKTLYTKFGLVKILSTLLILTTALVGAKILKDPEVLVNTDNLREVEVTSVLSLSSENAPLSLIGKVESKNEADLRAETQGEVTAVYAYLGQYVRAGQVLAEISNSRERAGVAGAQAGLDIAKSNLAKLTSGARGEEKDILSLSLAEAEDKLVQAKISALNTVNNAFAVADDILFNKIDEIFNNPRSERPEINFTVPDQNLSIRIVDGRSSVGVMLSSWSTTLSSTNTNSDLIKRLSDANENLGALRVFLTDVTRAVNTVEANIYVTEAEVASRRANMLLAKSSLNATISSVSAEVNALNSAITAFEVAKKNQEIGFTGGRNEDVVSLDASVRQAEASLASARANLEKTLIRTPISGELNLFSVRKGDFISLYAPVAVVSNNSSLVVTTYITEEESSDIKIGDKVILKKNTEGAVTAIAPSINPVNKKIEVTIAPDKASALINGETVRIYLDRNVAKNIEEPLNIRIPIKSIKIEPNRTIVFTVDAGGALTALPVELGSIVGERVIIKNGITFETEIVTDARGLKEGETVVISNL